ncbi:UNVERIFIED_CONTAM: hypothetical protein HDU68_001854, partial [Siphonaria sp. JEL0065]
TAAFLAGQKLSAKRRAAVDLASSVFGVSEETVFALLKVLVRRDNSDNAPHALLLLLADERTAKLNVVASLVRAKNDDSHPFHDQINSHVAEMLTPATVDNLAKQLKLSLAAKPPSNAVMDQKLAALWATQNLKEQKALLEILFLAFYDGLPCDPPRSAVLIETLDSVRFGLNQPNSSLFDETAHLLWKEVSHLCILVSLTLLDLEQISASLTNTNSTMDGEEEVVPTLAHYTNHLYEISKLLAKYSAVTNLSEGAVISPLLLAWGSLLQSIVDTPAAENLHRDYGLQAASVSLNFIQSANHLKVFEYLVSSIKSYANIDSHLNILGYKSVLKGLLKLFIQCFNVDDTPKFEDLAECFIQIFNDCPEISEQFWIQDYPVDECRSLLDAARARFPYEQRSFIRLLGSLCGNHTTAGFVFEYLKQLQTFTGPYQHSMVETFNGATTLAVPYDLNQGGSSRLPIYALRGSPVRIISVNPPVLLIYVSYSAFHLLVSQIDAFLEGSTTTQATFASSSTNLPPHTAQSSISCDVMSDWLHLLNNLLTHVGPTDIPALLDHLCELPATELPGFSSNDFVSMICRVFTKACNLSNFDGTGNNFSNATNGGTSHGLPTELLTVCLKTLALLLPSQPGIWNALRGEMPIPRYTSNDLSLTGSGRYMQQRLLPYEKSIGVYHTTLAFLDLVLTMIGQVQLISVESVNSNAGGVERFGVQAEVLMSCVKYVYGEIFPTFSGWRYAKIGDKLSIGIKVLQMYNRLVRDFTVLSPASETTFTTSSTLSNLRQFLVQGYLQGSQFQIAPLLEILGAGVDAPLEYFQALKLKEGLLLQESIIQGLEFVSSLLRERLILTNSGGGNISLLEHAILEHSVKTVGGKLGRRQLGQQQQYYLQQQQQQDVVELIHVLALYASYEYCLEIPKLSAELLTLLCSVASGWTPRPPSFIGYFGNDALSVVSHFVDLATSDVADLSNAENDDMSLGKEAIQRGAIQFVIVVLQTQPGLATLFLNGMEEAYKPSTSTAQAVSKDKNSNIIRKPSILYSVELVLTNWKLYLKYRPTVVVAMLNLIEVLWRGGGGSSLALPEFYIAVEKLVTGVTGFWELLFAIYSQEGQEGEGEGIWLDVCKSYLVKIFANQVFQSRGVSSDGSVSVIDKAVAKAVEYDGLKKVFEDALRDETGSVKRRLVEGMERDFSGVNLSLDLEAFKKRKYGIDGGDSGDFDYGVNYAYDGELLVTKGRNVLFDGFEEGSEEGWWLLKEVKQLNLAISRVDVDVSVLKAVVCFIKVATLKLTTSAWTPKAPAGGSPTLSLIKVCRLICETVAGVEEFSIQKLEVCTQLSSLLVLLLSLWAKEVTKNVGSIAKTEIEAVVEFYGALASCVANSRFREFLFTSEPLAHSYYNQIWSCHLITLKAISEVAAVVEDSKLNRATAEFCQQVLPYALRPLEQILSVNPLSPNTGHHSIILISLVNELLMVVDQTSFAVDASVALIGGSSLIPILLNFVSSVVNAPVDSSELFELEYLNCESSLQLLILFARIGPLADVLASNGLIASFCNSQLSQLVVNGGIPGYLGQDRNPLHRLWCLLMKVVSVALRNVSDPIRFHRSVIGFLKLHWHQIQAILSSQFEGLLNCASLEEIECFTELMHGVVLASSMVTDGDVDVSFLVVCREHVVHLYRQSVYFLRHPATLKAKAVYMGREDIEGVTSVAEKDFHDVFVKHIKALVILIDRNIVSFLCVAFNVEACIAIGDSSAVVNKGLSLSTLFEGLSHTVDTLSQLKNSETTTDLIQERAFSPENLCFVISQVISLIICHVIASNGEEGRREAVDNIQQTKSALEVLVRDKRGGETVKEAVKEINGFLGCI